MWEDSEFLAVVSLCIHHSSNGEGIANYPYEDYQGHVYQEDISQDSSIWRVFCKLWWKAVKVKIFSC